jgi:hypothetical protein
VPTEDLLKEIEEIGDIKRHLSLRWRMYSSTRGLYVQSGELPDGGVQYTAGGGQWRASIVFEKKANGTYRVRRYKPGDWEQKATDTLALCRMLLRAARVPGDWPEEKATTYMAREVADDILIAHVAAVDTALGRHREELAWFSDHTTQEERVENGRLFLQELEREWPIEYLETLRTREVRGRTESPVATESGQIVHQAYALGYMVARGWIGLTEASSTCLYLGDRLAAVARAASRNSSSRGVGFAGGLVPVVTRGTIRALEMTYPQ